MPFKPNYRYDRAERARSKEARKLEKLEAQAARRKAGRDDPTSTAESDGLVSTDTDGEDHGLERTGEEKH